MCFIQCPVEDNLNFTSVRVEVRRFQLLMKYSVINFPTKIICSAWQPTA